MWQLLFLFLFGAAQAIICPVGRLPRDYDTDLLSLSPSSCSNFNFERYDGDYTVVSSSNPNVKQTSCNLGPAELLFDGHVWTAWNSGFRSAVRKGGGAPTLAPLSEPTPTVTYVIFQTLNIKPIGMSIRNYGDTVHDTRLVTLSYSVSGTASGPWEVVGSLTTAVGVMDEQYSPLDVSSPQMVWKLAFRQPPEGDVFYGRDFQFYIHPFPVLLQPSLGGFPNTYYPLERNTTFAFDNDLSTYEEFDFYEATYLFFAHSYTNIENYIGVMWRTAGEQAEYGMSAYSLRPVTVNEKDNGNLRYGIWYVSDGQTAGIGKITNWHQYHTYLFIFSLRAYQTSQSAIRLAELSLVGCPFYSCPCTTATRPNFTSVTCTGGVTECTPIVKPYYFPL